MTWLWLDLNVVDECHKFDILLGRLGFVTERDREKVWSKSHTFSMT